MALDGDRLLDAAAAYRAWLVAEAGCTPEAAYRLSETLLPGDTVLFLENGEPGREALQRAQAYAAAVDAGHQPAGEEPIIYALGEVRLHPPIRPRLIRDFIAFEEHIRNSRRQRGLDVPPAWYEMPIYYKGNPASVIGPEATVPWPRYTEELDYELEIACIIGRAGRDIPEQEAGQYIFGYTIMNDFSARDIQLKEMSVGLGPAKGKDFATALGPWIVTPDEVGDIYRQPMIARVNGEVWSEGNSSSIHYTFEAMIAHALNSERLIPGDLIGSGTVGYGCGKELGRYLQPGDVVELEVGALGVLRNVVGQRPAR
ncbi:MAG TPA: fumarylacetoacetate hydrolase family protein [Limnochorda sp.]